MSDYLVGWIGASERITLHPHTEITALLGDRHLEHVRWADRRRGREETHPVANVFLMLGAVPNTEWLQGCVALDDKGFIRSGDGSGFERAGARREPSLLETSRPGVFAVGDVRAGSVKRVASAVGEGSIVLSAVRQVLGEA
jgi:thioredoxin reductase (NADPH)